MKARYSGSPHKGMSTVEILVATAILTLTLTAIILVVFGNQSLALDTQTNIEALAKAESKLEIARALGKEDFAALDDLSVVTEDIYETSLEVERRAQCQKQATSYVSWGYGGKEFTTSLTTLITDVSIALALGGDCDPTPPGDWDNPHTAVSLGFGGDGATDIDVYDGHVYITSNPSSPNKEDLYIYEFDDSDPDDLKLAERSKTDIGVGLNGIEVIRDQSTGTLYAYVLEDDNTNQLKVFDVTDPASPVSTGSFTLPNMNHTCSPASKPCLAGISVYAYDGLLYVGTDYIPNLALPETENNELHVYDLSDPAVPAWVGSENVNHNVYSIAAADEYIYVALSGAGDSIRSYDISTPSDPVLGDGFDPTGDEYATALYLLDHTLYVGRERVNQVSEQDFYILNVEDPTDIQEVGAENLDLNPNSMIKGLVVKDDLVFVAIDDPTLAFKILNISNPLDIRDHTVCSSLNLSENPAAIDMCEDYVFTANRSNDELRVLTDQTTACSP